VYALTKTREAVPPIAQPEVRQLGPEVAVFQPLKRANFIAKHNAPHFPLGDLAKRHLWLQNNGWPANKFVDLFMRAHKGATYVDLVFELFMCRQISWVGRDDVNALFSLLEEIDTPAFRAVDTDHLIPWLSKMVQGAASRSGATSTEVRTPDAVEARVGEQPHPSEVMKVPSVGRELAIEDEPTPEELAKARAALTKYHQNQLERGSKRTVRSPLTPRGPEQATGDGVANPIPNDVQQCAPPIATPDIGKLSGSMPDGSGYPGPLGESALEPERTAAFVPVPQEPAGRTL